MAINPLTALGFAGGALAPPGTMPQMPADGAALPKITIDPNEIMNTQHCFCEKQDFSKIFAECVPGDCAKTGGAPGDLATQINKFCSMAKDFKAIEIPAAPAASF